MFIVIVISLLVADTFGQIAETGPCKKYVPMENYNNAQFMGTWYLYAAYPTKAVNGRCIYEILTENPNGTVQCLVRALSIGPKPVPLPERVYETESEGPTITNIYPIEAPFFNARVLVLSTDYVSYAVRGYCENVGPSSSVNYFYIDTRTREEPSQKVLEKINQVLEDQGIPAEYFVINNRTNCPIF